MRQLILACVAAGFAATRLLAGPLGMPIFTNQPPDPAIQPAETGEVPQWTGSFTYSGATYTFTMVGTDPSLGSATTTIPVQIIPVIFKFSNGVTLDPTANSCGDSSPALSRVENSPLFQPTTFTPGGTNVGTTQYEDAFMRANFWNFVSSSASNYHILLGSPTVSTPVTITVPQAFGQTAAGSCSAGGATNNGQVGLMAYDYYRILLRQILNGIPSTTLPIVLNYNTFWYQATTTNCCILGFHGATGKAPNQGIFSTAAYSDPGLFSVPIQDIHALSHELGEAINDPFVNNKVPGWTGGQVSGCSTILEVGDPVTGIAFEVTMNGFTYHPEDLVFLPWFEKSTAPTTSVNGWYTFLNSFPGPTFCK